MKIHLCCDTVDGDISPKIELNDGVLSILDFTDYETCIDCIKGKQTNKSKKGVKRSSDILEIIHTDICSPDMDSYN